MPVIPQSGYYLFSNIFIHKINHPLHNDSLVYSFLVSLSHNLHLDLSNEKKNKVKRQFENGIA